MWAKVSKLITRPHTPTSRSQPTKTAMEDLNRTMKSSSSPFKARVPTQTSQTANHQKQLSLADSVRLAQSNPSSLASISTTFKCMSKMASSSVKNTWNAQWSDFKFSSPPGSRQAYYETIRNNITAKYGSLANSILMVLSAVATDALFWWLAELLLDDGM